MKKIVFNVLKIVLSTVFLLSILFYSKSVLSLFYSSHPPGCVINLPRKGRSGTKEPTPEQLQSGKGVGSITWSEETGGPKNIRGPLTAPSEDDAENIALRFLEEKKALYGIEDPYQDFYKIKSGVSQWTGHTYIHFGQIYKGVSVRNRLVISVASNGVISSIQGLYYSDLEVDVKPKVCAEEAKEIALAHELNCGSPFDAVPEGMKPSKTFFPWFYETINEEFMKSIKPELLIWPTGNKDYLLWRFRIKWWRFYIDAHDGVIRGAYANWYPIEGGGGIFSETSEETNTAWPNMEVTPGSLDFGKIRIGSNSPVKEVIIANKGEVDLIIADISLSESAFALKEFSGSFPLAVAPEENLTLKLCFSPTSSGVVEGAMLISGNDPYYPQFEITLQGTGAAKTLHITRIEDLFYYQLPYYAFWPNAPWTYENMKKSGILPQDHDLSWYNLSPYNYFDKNSYSTSLYFPFTDFFNLPNLKPQYGNYFYPWLLQASDNFNFNY